MQCFALKTCRITASSLSGAARIVKPGSTSLRCLSSDKPPTETPVSEATDSDGEKPKLSGFAHAFEKYTAPEPEVVATPKSFATLLRHSKLIDLGDPQGKIVCGTVFHIVKDDLYIDFGWKFHCVCPRPSRYGDKYVEGSSVLVRINDLELSTRFLGATKDLTILEADCTLLGTQSYSRERPSESRNANQAPA
ncbi:28S ribosomal protein S28, mitochondrial [Diprion similis]|uniref:28S ribosomal protein S28, mitochondrial n=1 Tax=Diprion similis TaxID=362088 RepID=UPI001EF99974|nr:28S ribosomal protein S28, mitochondrial [Diprion similis]